VYNDVPTPLLRSLSAKIDSGQVTIEYEADFAAARGNIIFSVQPLSERGSSTAKRLILDSDNNSGRVIGILPVNSASGEYYISAYVSSVGFMEEGATTTAYNIFEDYEAIVSRVYNGKPTVLYRDSYSLKPTDFRVFNQSQPDYSLSTSSASVNEGSTALFILNTSNVTSGTFLSYVISGVQASDILGGQLIGSVTVDAQGRASISVPVLADNLTEGTETMTVTVRSATASVTINDTSLAPAAAYNEIQGTEGADLLNGTSSVDQINTRGGNDTIVGSAGADTIDGGAGLDLVRYNSSSVSASLSKNDAGEIFVRSGSETDTLISVERLQFTDQWVATDLNGAAGVAGRMIVAAFGRESLSEFSGIGISLVDQGWSSSQLAELIVSAGLLPSGNAEFVKVVYQNVIGNAPNALELAFYVQLLENSSHTQSTLLELAANTTFSANAVEQSAIGFVGLVYQPSLIQA
jgi:hypothetical protein